MDVGTALTVETSLVRGVGCLLPKAQSNLFLKGSDFGRSSATAETLSKKQSNTFIWGGFVLVDAMTMPMLPGKP